MVVLQEKVITESSTNLIFRYAAYDTMRKHNIIPHQETNKENMEESKQKNVRLEKDVSNITIRKNPDSTSVIYLTDAKVLQYIMMTDNRTDKKRQTSKHQRRQPPARFAFNKSDIKIFINAKTSWIISCLTLRKPCFSLSFPSHLTASRTPFSTS